MYPIRTDSVDPNAIGREFCELRDELCLQSQFEFPQMRTHDRPRPMQVGSRAMSSVSFAYRPSGIQSAHSATRLDRPPHLCIPMRTFAFSPGVLLSPLRRKTILLRFGLFFGRGGLSRNTPRTLRRHLSFPDTTRTGSHHQYGLFPAD